MTVLEAFLGCTLEKFHINEEVQLCGQFTGAAGRTSCICISAHQ